MNLLDRYFEIVHANTDAPSQFHSDVDEAFVLAKELEKHLEGKSDYVKAMALKTLLAQYTVSNSTNQIDFLLLVGGLLDSIREACFEMLKIRKSIN